MCKIEKDLSEFSKDNHAKSGLHASCKQCDILKSAAYYAKNKVKRLAKTALWQKSNPDKVRKYQLKYRRGHPEKVKEFNARHQQKYPDEGKIRTAEYKKSNPEKVKITNENYRQRNRETVRSNNAIYLKTPKGKVANKRKQDSRKRELGWNPINEWFSGAVGHHLLYDGDYKKNNSIGIYIPKNFHKADHGRHRPEEQRDVNIIATKWLMDNGESEEVKKIAAYLYYKYCVMPIPSWFVDEYNQKVVVGEII